MVSAPCRDPSQRRVWLIVSRTEWAQPEASQSQSDFTTAAQCLASTVRADSSAHWTNQQHNNGDVLFLTAATFLFITPSAGRLGFRVYPPTEQRVPSGSVGVYLSCNKQHVTRSCCCCQLYIPTYSHDDCCSACVCLWASDIWGEPQQVRPLERNSVI